MFDGVLNTPLLTSDCRNCEISLFTKDINLIEDSIKLLSLLLLYFMLLELIRV